MFIILACTNALAQDPPSQNQATAVVDSLSSDSSAIQKPKSKSGLESKVEYKAVDSMRFDVANQKVYMYKGGEVYYETTALKADFVELNLANNEVYAEGVTDTNGYTYGSPVFNDKDQEFESKNMRYNFSSRKGLISQAVTQQGDGYVIGGLVKKQPDNVIYIKDGQFCPCKDPDAITYIHAKKIKIIPDDKVVTGVANLKLGNIPTPLILPFGIFPNKRGAASGVILPQYGFSPGQGMYLQNGGFYWAMNDKLHMQFTGDIYSRGSWGLGFQANYRERYKYNGNLQLRYTELKTGSAETFDLREENIYKIYWKHFQDPKANPYQSFSADVNIYKNNRLDINNSAQEYLSNNFKSNLNYTRKFGNSPFRLTANSSYDLNTVDTNSNVVFTLPQLTLNMDRIYPFKRKYKIGRDKWYEKIGLTYSSNMVNRIVSEQDSLFTQDALDNMQNGMNHSFGLNTSYKLMKVFTIQPTFNYKENWEFKNIERDYIEADTTLTDTIASFTQETINREFGRYGTWNAGAQMSTKIYGMYTYRNGPIKGIRHVMTPSVGFTYTPDYTGKNYIRELKNKEDSILQTYSIYNTTVSPYGNAPIGSETGNISINLRNNLEMKIKSKKDTVKGEKKIKLLDQLNFGTAYNVFADSMNWSDINIIANTNLFNFFRINYNSRINLYALDEFTNASDQAYYKAVDKFELSETGNLGRFTSHRLGINFTLGNKKAQQKRKEQIKKMEASPFTFQNIPWTLSFGYTYNYQKPTNADSKVITQSLQLQTTINLTKNWKFEGMTNYDFEQNDFGYTRFSLYRDMKCWEARITVVPKGGQQNYNFSINLKPQMFKDLKVERKRNYYDFN